MFGYNPTSVVSSSENPLSTAGLKNRRFFLALCLYLTYDVIMKQKIVPKKAWVRKSIQVDQGLYQRLATLAAELEITIRSLVNEAFEDLLNKKR